MYYTDKLKISDPEILKFYEERAFEDEEQMKYLKNYKNGGKSNE